MSRRVRSLLAVPALATTATLLLAGCGESADGEREDRRGKSAATGPSTASPTPSTKPASLEELADAVGCAKPEVAGKTLDYRQGLCETDEAQYILLTFDTAQGQREWLKVSQMYGGVYLVGNRWVLSADPHSAMEAAREKLGGTIEETGAYDASPSAA